LASLEAKICELQVKAEGMRGKRLGHYDSVANGAVPSLRGMWEELIEL